MAQIEKENRNGNCGVIACDDITTADVATSESSDIEVIKTESNAKITVVYIAPSRHNSVQNSTTIQSEPQSTILLMGIPPGLYQQVLMRKME